MGRPLFAAALAVVALAAGCTASDPDEAAVDDLDGLEEGLPGDLEGALGPDPVEVDDDGNLRAQGVVLPIPEGWEVDPASLESGLVFALPPGSEGLPALFAAAGIEANPFLGFQGLDFESTLSILRELDPEGDARRDEAITVAGAERAHLLVFEALSTPTAEGQPAFPDTDQLVVIAEDEDQQLAIFNYSAEVGTYDESVEALLLAEAGLDPDSEPALPELPELPEDELDG